MHPLESAGSGSFVSPHVQESVMSKLDPCGKRVRPICGASRFGQVQYLTQRFLYALQGRCQVANHADHATLLRYTIPSYDAARPRREIKWMTHYKLRSGMPCDMDGTLSLPGKCRGLHN